MFGRVRTNGRNNVSVPFRGFRGLQGVLGGYDVDVWAETFQSPSGVLGVCREQKKSAIGVSAMLFQSPSGVLGVCGVENKPYMDGPLGVSVPFRGFRGLRGKKPSGLQGH